MEDQETSDPKTFDFIDPSKANTNASIELTEGQKKRYFLMMNFFDVIGTLTFAYNLPFYPDIAAKAGLSYSQIGLTFTCNFISFVLSSFLLRRIVIWFGKKTCTIFCLTLYSVILVLNGAAVYLVDNTNAFFGLMIFNRLFTGLYRCIFLLAVYAYINQYWPENFQRYFAQVEIFRGYSFVKNQEVNFRLGFVIGPFIGTIFNYWLGYAGPYYLYALILFVGVIFFWFATPHDIKKTVSEDDKLKRLNLSSVAFKKEIFSFALLVLANFGGQCFFSPILVNHMKTFGIGPNITAIVIFIPGLAFLLTNLFVPALKKWFVIVFTISIGSIICQIGCYIIAPFWGISSSWIPAVIGLTLQGASQPFVNVNGIPYFKQKISQLLKMNDMDEEYSSMANSLYTISLSASQLIMPSLAGKLYDTFGGNVDGYEFEVEEEKAFQLTYLIYAIIQLVIFANFILIGGGYNGWKEQFRKFIQKNQQPEEEILISKQFFFIYFISFRYKQRKIII